MDRALLEDLFRAAVAAADPGRAVAAHLPPKPRGRTVVVGAGKASAQMAAAFERHWGEPVGGLVVTRYGYGVPTSRIEIVEASHPVPDEAGYLAARRIMSSVHGLGPDDLVVALISGGGSALLPAPGAGMSFDDEQEVTRILLASGLPISVMNQVRNELSAIKGGRLAALAAPARVATLIVSDVAGDDPALVASGPTVPIAGSRAEVRHLLALHGVTLPPAATALLASADNPAPRPDDPRFASNSVTIVASSALSLEAAASLGRQRGLNSHILSDAIEGEARDVAQVLAALSKEVDLRDRPFRRPALLLSGGETTVTVRGKGKGGRNSEFLLSFALAIEGVDGISALAADTDGIDGSEDNAGAVADGTTCARMRQAGIDPRAALAGNDAYTAFKAIDALVVTGPTGTNVNDFRAILIR
ncbi:MAG: glycerate kinase [Devosia sp. 67-54]|uniref:glycerate kinase type-2 family protein n=1 Tax=unclassified Devosia TaxID=196773 RepID=UPI00095FBF53|nr:MULTISPECIES: glycerate kinase [unclassified Devosia]MBN9304578.1 glycerate kinase [Devosia sp.]OJX15430.1 MAG: glycerate kinase [Devosia sp. 67-54]